MQIKNSLEKYGMVSILLHWLMAILIVGLLIAGLLMVRIPVSAFKLKLFGWHKEFGILVLMLVMLRIVWRIWNINPSLKGLQLWERCAARTVHWAFYGFMIALPVSGWLVTSAAGLPASFFGLFTLPDLIAVNENLRIELSEVHEWLGYGLIATFCLHVAAALKHHFINKDDILRRMF
jgi:cytochrome b561